MEYLDWRLEDLLRRWALRLLWSTDLVAHLKLIKLLSMLCLHSQLGSLLLLLGLQNLILQLLDLKPLLLLHLQQALDVLILIHQLLILLINGGLHVILLTQHTFLVLDGDLSRRCNLVTIVFCSWRVSLECIFSRLVFDVHLWIILL